MGAFAVKWIYELDADYAVDLKAYLARPFEAFPYTQLYALKKIRQLHTSVSTSSLEHAY